MTNIALRKGARVASLPLTPVMAFIDTSDTIIGTEIAQINSRYIRPGQSAEITFKFLPGHVYRACVEAVPPGRFDGAGAAHRLGGDVGAGARSCLLPERNPTRRIRLEDFRQKAPRLLSE